MLNGISTSIPGIVTEVSLFNGCTQPKLALWQPASTAPRATSSERAQHSQQHTTQACALGTLEITWE